MVEKKLKDIKSVAKQMNLLKFEFSGLYIIVCKARGLNTDRFTNWCKNFENDPNPLLFSIYIHGYLIPHIA